MNDVTSLRGGAGRGQGRKPISEDGAKAYKLLLTDEQRTKLDKLGNAAWIRQQIDFATHLKEINLNNAVNLSGRYIRAMRDLPQFTGRGDYSGPLTHLMLGHQVIPLGELTDAADDSGWLQIIYPGGHTIDVIGHYYFKQAVKEAAEIELATTPGEFLPEKKWSEVQMRSDFLDRYLTSKFIEPD